MCQNCESNKRITFVMSANVFKRAVTQKRFFELLEKAIASQETKKVRNNTGHEVEEGAPVFAEREEPKKQNRIEEIRGGVQQAKDVNATMGTLNGVSIIEDYEFLLNIIDSMATGYVEIDRSSSALGRSFKDKRDSLIVLGNTALAIAEKKLRELREA